MIKVRTINPFTLKDYNKLSNVEKLFNREPNAFDVGDTFECDEEMVQYLTGKNEQGLVVVEIVEVIPDIKEKEEKEEIKEQKETKETKEKYFKKNNKKNK